MEEKSCQCFLMLLEIHIVNMRAGRKNAIVEDEIKNKHYKFLLLHEVL